MTQPSSQNLLKLVILTGMSDEDNKKNVMGIDGLDGKTLNQTIAIIETKEMAARSISGSIAPPSDAMLRCLQCQTNEHPLENFC